MDVPFPYTPRPRDLILFLLGCFFSYAGISQHLIWLTILGELLLEISLFIASLSMLSFLYRDLSLDLLERKEIFYTFFIVCLAIFLTTIFIILYHYFDFNVLREIRIFINRTQPVI